jgi:hypothetical protein
MPIETRFEPVLTWIECQLYIVMRGMVSIVFIIFQKLKIHGDEYEMLYVKYANENRTEMRNQLKETQFYLNLSEY